MWKGKSLCANVCWAAKEYTTDEEEVRRSLFKYEEMPQVSIISYLYVEKDTA